MSYTKPFLVVGVLFILLFFRTIIVYSSQQGYVDGKEATFTVTLLTDPRTSGKFQKFTVEPEGREKIFITAPFLPQYHYGQDIRVSGKVSVKKALSNSSRDGDEVLSTKNVINTMLFPEIEATDNALLSPLAGLRKDLIIIFSSALSPASSGLLLGIVFGIRSTLPQQFYEALQNTGVVHITAASGMNVTMVAGAIFLLFATFLKRQMAIILSILCIWFYALLAGLEPSIFRAATMSSLAFGAGLLGRQNTSILTLCITGFVMVMYKPTLVGDIGFQLSFLSTLGIILLGPLLRVKRDIHDPLGKSQVKSVFGFFAEDIKMTIAAQLATIPILLVHFGQYNLLSVLVNALILWTIPILMILGGLGGLLGLLLKPLGVGILYISLPLLLYVQAVIEFFAQHTVTISLPNVPYLIVLGYYLLFAAVLLFFRSKRV